MACSRGCVRQRGDTWLLVIKSMWCAWVRRVSYLAKRPVSRANLLSPSTTPWDGMYAMWHRPWNGSRFEFDVDANSMSRTCGMTPGTLLAW